MSFTSILMRSTALTLGVVLSAAAVAWKEASFEVLTARKRSGNIRLFQIGIFDIPKRPLSDPGRICYQ